MDFNGFVGNLMSMFPRDGLRDTYQFHLTGDLTKSLFLVIEEREVTLFEGEVSHSGTTIRIASEDLKKILSKDLHIMTALLTGKIKIEGSLSKVMGLTSFRGT